MAAPQSPADAIGSGSYRAVSRVDVQSAVPSDPVGSVAGCVSHANLTHPGDASDAALWAPTRAPTEPDFVTFGGTRTDKFELLRHPGSRGQSAQHAEGAGLRVPHRTGRPNFA
jgi:hypothetical protein